MIKNERQYRITKAQIDKFVNALEQLASQSDSNQQVHPILRKAEADALQSQLSELRKQIEEYEALKSGQSTVLELNSLEELPRALIKARIAAGFSQKELADRLGIKEQQIQRYEDTEYASASLARLREVSQALGIKIREDVFLPTSQVSVTNLFNRLKQVGIDRNLVLRRLLPQSEAASIQIEKLTEEEESSLVFRLAILLQRVFKLTLAEIFNSSPLQLNTAAIGTARFKVSARTDERRLSAYTVYAHFLALLLLDATSDLPKKPIPTNAKEVREAIISTYGSVTFENTLQYVWSLGIPVLPLKDPSAFHGAFWRVGGRNVIVLKQQTSSAARWLFDLLHELFHASREPNLDERTVVEAEETATERRESQEEIEVNLEAGNVVLGGRAEELAQMCVETAKGSVERLKKVVPQIANRENVPVDSLANYMAFRLSIQGINWWGAATNLQATDQNPWQIARDFLLERSNFGQLNEVDRNLLLQALSDLEN
ncbi:helix-turn-helix domain-containing protein [Floridanema evergladense]|uniref:Multiprotein-bridging factor 1 family protein n=1 Tax=Floridaenema evergladense BLCC-F167 TaxID=3153639 RepID=A0ABV4WN67_9CYAN